MEDQAEVFVEELFKKYRVNFETLEALFVKKGIELPSVSHSIKVKGEVFSSQDIAKEKWDWAVHTCGLNSYPTELGVQGQSKYLLEVYDFSPTQETELVQIFDSFQINMNLFHESVENAKGLWIDYLNSVDTQNYLKEVPRREPGEHLNFTGQYGDVLGMLISGYKKQIVDMVQTPSFKKIKDTSSPGERMAVISKYFLKLFIEKYYKCEHFELTKCINCNSDFYPQSNTEWVNKIPPIFCDICLTMGFSASTDFNKRLGFTLDERKENFKEGVKIYSEYFGYIPSVKYQKRKVMQQLNQAGIAQDELAYAMKVSSLLPWTGTAKELFGSWAHLLEEAGLLSQRQRGRGGHQSIASDGHLCLSMGERAICEFLTKKSILHEKEPMYPIDEQLNPNGLLRGDFLIDTLIIEFAGMMSNPDYAEKMKTKEALAKSRNIPWLKLETSKLDDLNEMLFLIKSKVPSLDV
jgi:hypothetical protein